MTNRYKICNHHHELTDRHTIVDFGDGEFVANCEAVALLKALNDVGLHTRTHHIDGSGYAFVSILLDKHVRCEIRSVYEKDADRTRYNGCFELLISWSQSERCKRT